jgi:4-amino-4-deoxy-L-arabinose transferase-like glycosyltransferase
VSAPIDSEAQLARVLRVREVLRVTRIGLGLVVILGISALLAATATAPLDRLYVGIAAWFFGQVAAIAAVLAGLRAIRRRRFGAAPSSRLRRPSDVMLYVAAAAGGALALAGFAPPIAAGAATGVDVAIAAIGLALALAGLRAAGLYVLRE